MLALVSLINDHLRRHCYIDSMFMNIQVIRYDPFIESVPVSRSGTYDISCLPVANRLYTLFCPLELLYTCHSIFLPLIAAMFMFIWCTLFITFSEILLNPCTLLVLVIIYLLRCRGCPLGFYYFTCCNSNSNEKPTYCYRPLPGGSGICFPRHHKHISPFKCVRSDQFSFLESGRDNNFIIWKCN